MFLDQFESAGISEISAAVRESTAWREKRKPSVWAEQERKLAPGQSPLSTGQTIPYRHAVMPHCVEQMDSADDPNIRIIALWEAIRDGKTNGTCLNIFGRTVTDDPGNVYSVHPTDDDAAKFSNDDIEGIIGACLEGYFVEKKSRDSGRTVGYKKFMGGGIRIVSAKSITKFRGTSVKVLFCHEIDALNTESIFKAFGRTTGFADAIIIVEGTGTYAPSYDKDGKIIYNSRIQEFYDKGDRRKWFGPCRVCDALQWLQYDQFTWPAGHMAKAVWLCRRCAAAHNEKQWRDFQYNARWYPTAGLTPEQEKDIAANYRKARALDPTVRSYWRNGFNRLLPVGKGFKTALHEIVAKGEAAKSSVEALKIWKQEEAAELWDPTTEGEAPPAWKPIYNRRKDYGFVVPAGGLFLTVFIDVQAYRLEVEWTAWGRNEHSFGMDHVVLDGATEHEEVWAKLRTELQRKFQHEFGATISLGFGLIDAGKWPDRVYAFLRGLAVRPLDGVTGKVRASKGVGQFGHPIIDTTYRTVGKVLKGHNIGTWEAKDRIYERLKMMLPNREEREANAPEIPHGWMEFNMSFSEEFFQQATSEQVTITFEKGEEVRKYINPNQARNEGLDLLVGNLAAYRLRPRNFDLLEAELKARAEEAKRIKEGKQPVTELRQPNRRKRSGWLNSWKDD